MKNVLGDEWLKTLPKQEQYKVLGLDGLKAWQNGADWRNYARNYSTDYAKTRLKDLNIKPENDIIKVSKITLFAQPNAITERISSKGGIERNFYDEKGRQYKQIANNNHGNAKNHPYGKHGEHAHDYIYDKEGKLVNRTTRELTDDERKEVEDIL
ncbi:hypothetical protein [Megamonas hypermegale]|uniref:hypothetical protein n=1 Tax=Megamonas hypermegale TaxID=158847 RepID=UPI0019566F3F|nr:hypothetical protein [Megamonas hypermegale]MBM6834323.1 hypothetical protein [Megamonas hypermegale]